MTTLEELGALPPIAIELDLFDYVPLDSPREPPSVKLLARLARSYEGDDSEAEGLRLAFVAGHPIESDDLLVLAYLWRPPRTGVAWGFERWSPPDRRLRPYRHDPTFEPRPAAEVHAELRELGPASLVDSARRLVEGHPPTG